MEKNIKLGLIGIIILLIGIFISIFFEKLFIVGLITTAIGGLIIYYSHKLTYKLGAKQLTKGI